MSALYVLSGPPPLKENDELFIKKFLALDGKKAVCGSATLKIFCKATGKNATVKTESLFSKKSTRYDVDGLDYASEGVITLNSCLKDLQNSQPNALAKLMLEADEIVFICGGAQNNESDLILFKSENILPRNEIIDKIIDALRKFGKIARKEEVML